MTYYMNRKYGTIVSDTREGISVLKENWTKVYVVDPGNEAQMNAIGEVVGMPYRDVQELVAKLMEPKPVDALRHIPVSVGTQTMETLCGIKLPVGRPVNITGSCEYCKSKALDQREWRAN